MDKSWIELRDRTLKTYTDEVESFLNFAFKNKSSTSRIYCPCKRCSNRMFENREAVKAHLIINGFLKTYKNWMYHGEQIGSSSSNIVNEGDDMVVNDPLVNLSDGINMPDMIHEGYGIPHTEEIDNNEAPNIEDVIGLNGNVAKFFSLLKDAEDKLYENCPNNVTVLSFVVELLHLKQLNGWTNYSFTMLLKFLKKIFPFAKISKSYYHANKLTSDLHFNYETWDACPNNCMLFRNTENLEKCKICDALRYKVGSTNEDEHNKKVAAKKVRYFPLKPRLQWLFWSSKTASLMKWHEEEHTNDGVIRHPADSLAWKAFDEKYPYFARESRNVRLGLATDGFNPFGNMSIAHSTWPIVLMPYNLPPWLCMKQPHFILSVLIDGPKGPGDKIDVFLEPLIDELKKLWIDGVSTYDASTKELFRMHAALLWTISDFPAYASLSGWCTKGQFACPICNIDPQSVWLKNGSKWCYWGHRRYLTPQHRFRKDRQAFNGNINTKPAPRKVSGLQVL